MCEVSVNVLVRETQVTTVFVLPSLGLVNPATGVLVWVGDSQFFRPNWVQERRFARKGFPRSHLMGRYL
jgi:hypothetical protein